MTQKGKPEEEIKKEVPVQEEATTTEEKVETSKEPTKEVKKEVPVQKEAVTTEEKVETAEEVKKEATTTEEKVEPTGEVKIETSEADAKELNTKEEDIKTKQEKRGHLAEFNVDSWTPKTEVGKKVKNNMITSIDEILNLGLSIKEAEIIDILIPNVHSELLMIGQAKGKFGGGQKRVFRQTQKKTKEGNKPSFSTCAVIGDMNGHVGIGFGKSRETVPAREKAFKQAKLNIMKIRRGAGSWESADTEPNSIPFKVEGKCGSVRMVLIPAPKGTGLKIEQECAKILKVAGIKDVWSKVFGNPKAKINLIKACEEALRQLVRTKTLPHHIEKLGIVEGNAGSEK
jgi:small subunit ribosomal protein S5